MASKKVDNTRNLAPMTDPIAYRESYSESDIIKNPNDLIVYQEGKANNGGETAGSTVAQNNQSNAQNQSGTTYDGTDGNGRITVGPQNANLNYYQYGDDSNPNQQSQKGGMNDKYTGEGVRTSNLEFDKNITRADLDPNYLYGEAARQQNRKEAGYIARRNDMIASALYNEGLTSKDDVANFLSQQNQWMNSTEADRMNTIESVWKRLGQIQPEREQPDLSKAEDIVQDTSGKLYGKTTADEGNPKQGIDTLADKNNVLTAMQQGRVVSLQDFVSQDPKNIAVCITQGITGWSEQTWRDAQQYYPEFIAEVNAEVKKINTQANVTAIASGGEMVTNTNGQSSISNEMANFGLNNATSVKSAAEITNDVKNAMAEKQSANEASETMATIEEDMAILKNRLKNLREEANRAFKGDVPDYMVNAYISNKTQEIQNQMSILEDRYNAAYNRYKTELAQTQWEKEYQLKEKQLQIQRDTADANIWATRQGIAIDWYKAKGSVTGNTSTTNSGDTYEVTTMSDEEVAEQVDHLLDLYDNGQLGNAQCAAGIQKYYLPLLGISLPNLSSIENKTKLVNEDSDYVPKKGDLIILKSKSAPKNGHIGIVIGVAKDGTIQYMDWNGSLGADGKGTEKVAISGINPNSNSIIGFRNINKGISGNATSWSETDYNNFEAFVDFNNDKLTDSERKTMAKTYGFGEDLNGMYNFAQEQLKNRESSEMGTSEAVVTPKGTVSTNSDGRTVITDDKGDETVYAYGVTADDPRLQEEGFDPVLGYNTLWGDLYKAFNNPSKVSGDWIANQEAGRNRKEGQLAQEAANYARAQEKGLVKSGETKSPYAENVLRAIADLYNISADENGRVDFDISKDWYSNSPRIKKYEQIKNLLTLETMVNARASEIGFGQVTEGEWAMLSKAASALGSAFWENDVALDEELQNIVKAAWEMAYDEPLTNGRRQIFRAKQYYESHWKDNNGNQTNPGGNPPDIS